MVVYKWVYSRGVLLPLFILGSILPFRLHAQGPYIPFHHISSVDGLSQNQVLSIIEDRKGFMWFGTLEGLNRFDGYEFVVYRHAEGDTTSLADDYANTLVEDNDGSLWIGTRTGLSRFNEARHTFSSFTHDPKNDKSISSGLINRMIKDRFGNLWIAFATGYIDYFDIAKKEFSHFQISTNQIDITSLVEEADGSLWVGTESGLLLMNKQHQVVRRFEHDDEDANSLSNNHVNDIFQDRTGTIWIATDDGLNQYLAGKGFVHYKHSDLDTNTLSVKVIKCIEEDREGRLWIGTINGGLNIWDRKKDKVYRLMPDATSHRNLHDNSFYSIYRDRRDNIWLGTNSTGIEFYDCRSKPFVVYQHAPGIATSLSNNKVNAVAEQPGKGFWVATDGGGLNFFDSKQGVFKSYRYRFDDPATLPSDFVVDLIWDKDDKCLWVATWGGGFARFDPATGRFRRFQHNEKDPTSLASNNLWRLYQDERGVIYIGTVGSGLSIYDKKTSRITNYSTSQGLGDENVVCLFKDQKDVLWMGSWGNGFSGLDLKQMRPAVLPPKVDFKSEESILADSLGRLWICGSQGILCYDPKSDSSVLFTANDGFPHSIVNGMVDDMRGNFWLSTNNGIVKFNVAKRKFYTYTVADGLPANQFSNRLLRASDGKMYFGSVNGLVVFHPDSIHQDPTLPTVAITDLKIFNKSVFAGGKENILSQSITDTKEIWLPYEYNFITLSYVALNYTFSSKSTYAYKMEGFNNDWVYIDGQRSATYTSLEPGTYVFKVKASNNDGVWNEEGTQLTIHVLPPWWQTYWFRTLMVVLAIVSIAGIYRYRLRNIRKLNAKLSMLVAERTKELEQLNEAKSQQNKLLQERQEEIEAQNEELKQSKEEISAQWDTVIAQNQKLEEAHATIERQHLATKQLNDNLEQEVQSRTRELLEYNKQLEQFAFISAHNLRAPVARILGLGNVLELDPANVEENKMLFRKMVSTAHELDRVVRDLNTILEIKKNNTSFLSKINLAEELELIKRYIDKEIEETGCLITEDFSRAPVVYSVKPYVESILQNLLSNAIKYRYPNRVPFISIKTEPADGYICMTVSDNGLGIDTGMFKDKIFNLYQRFHSHVEGRGLGLYLIKTQIQSLGGKIEVESKLNVGTTFKVYFKNVESVDIEVKQEHFPVED